MYRPKTDEQKTQLPEELLPLRETLAEQVHDAWAAARLDEGWQYGPELDRKRRTHPSLIPYEQLPESEKEYDRRTAAAAIRCILDNGYAIRPEEPAAQANAPEGWPPETPQPCVMRKGTEEKKLSYELMLTSATALQWHGADGSVRLPKEKTAVYRMGLPFLAAGRLYTKLSQLTAVRRPGPPSPWYLDRYGRKVFHVWEGVPKFDSSDNCDDRGFSWYFICENGVLTRIQSSGRTKICVTEDVAFLENSCWREMERCGYPECR